MLLASIDASSPVGLVHLQENFSLPLFYGGEPNRLAELSSGMGQRRAHRGLSWCFVNKASSPVPKRFP